MTKQARPLRPCIGMYIIWRLVCINFEKQEVEQGSCAEQEQKPTDNDSFEQPHTTVMCNPPETRLHTLKPACATGTECPCTSTNVI